MNNHSFLLSSLINIPSLLFKYYKMFTPLTLLLAIMENVSFNTIITGGGVLFKSSKKRRVQHNLKWNVMYKIDLTAPESSVFLEAFLTFTPVSLFVVGLPLAVALLSYQWFYCCLFSNICSALLLF